MDYAAQSLEKRTRLSKPKVRSGCRTCKNRHLKCDERRPTCLRCERARMECLGYVDPNKKKKSESRQPDIRRLLPRPARPSTPSSSGSGMPTPPPRESPLPRPPDPPPPLREEEGLVFTGQDAVYFDVFRRQLVRDLFHLSSNADFWTRQVLRQTATDSCVRQSVLAIGALAQALRADDHHHQQDRGSGRSSGSGAVSPPLDSRSVLNEHHEAALAHHVEALSMFRNLFAAEQPSPARASTVLIVTLLFITFELLQGNMPAADNLITTGIILLKDCIRTYRAAAAQHSALLPLTTTAAAAAAAPTPKDEADDIELLLPRLAIMSTYSPFCLSQRKRFPLVTSAAAAGAAAVEPRDLAPTAEVSGDELRSRWGRLFTTSMVFITRVVGYHIHNLPYDAAAVRRKQADLVRQLDRWRLLVESGGGGGSYASDPADPPSRDYLQLVGTHILFCRTFMECCADSSELLYDGFVSVFRELLRRCEVLAARCREQQQQPPLTAAGGSSTSTSSSPSHGVGIVPVLLFITAKCRIRRIRTAALDLLRRLPWREEDAIWDLRRVIAGHAAQIELEERGILDGGFVPTTSRFIWSGGTWDEDRCTLGAVFTGAVPNDDGTPHIVELDLKV